jgi:hypothetical protein
MARPVFSSHARQQIEERRIREEWIWRVLDFPDLIQLRDDDNMHYMKVIHEFGGRVLRVVVNEQKNPSRIVTVFFDRQMTREWEN